MEESNKDGFMFCKKLHIMSNKIKRLGGDNLAKHNITFCQLRILRFIAENFSGEVLQSSIEKEFGIRRSSVTSILSNMEKSGIIERSPAKKDARVKQIELTEKGIKLDKDLKSFMQNIDRELVSGFSDEEKFKFCEYLDKALNNLSRIETEERNGNE